MQVWCWKVVQVKLATQLSHPPQMSAQGVAQLGANVSHLQKP